MAIKEENTRVLITMPKELKRKMEETAKEENRTVTNLVVTILTKYFDRA